MEPYHFFAALKGPTYVQLVSEPDSNRLLCSNLKTSNEDSGDQAPRSLPVRAVGQREPAY